MPWRSNRLPGLEWVVASAMHRAERESGDSCVVRALADAILVAVIDGLGHGSEAARAARRAREVIEGARDRDLRTIVRACHESLPDTRGVVIGVAALDPAADSLSWLGVGNVAAHVLRAERAAQAERARLLREELIVRSGTVGVRLPPLDPIVRPVRRGDLIVLATDGLNAGFTRRVASIDAPLKDIADGILAAHHRANDDALVFVGRYVGRQELVA